VLFSENIFNFYYFKLILIKFIYSYNGLWYAAPLHTQKLLLFIMQRGTINTLFVCGRIYVASLEGFATVKLKFF